MTGIAPSRQKVRYRWSHRHPLHRAAVRLANKTLPLVPFRAKYALTDLIRRRALPYRLLTEGSVAVQVGAPRDTLLAGRSRAMAFVLRAGRSGRVLVVEPEPTSVREFRRAAEKRGFAQVTVRQAGAWSEPTTITLEVDPAHPATNFTDGTTEYSATERSRFQHVQVTALPLDDLIDEAGLAHVDLVSITTNGAESHALRGLARTIARDHPYLCLAYTQSSYDDLMRPLGYRLLGQDDRSFTFHHVGDSDG